MKRSLWILALAGAASACSMAASAEPPRVVADEVFGVPVAQMPPTGKCRVWYPTEPPGRQPPSGECEQLLASVPSGAWLLFRPDDRRRVIRVN